MHFAKLGAVALIENDNDVLIENSA